MYQTQYVRAESLADVERLLADEPEAKILAGGQTLIPTLKQRLAAPSHLIDIGRLPELKGVTLEGDEVIIGAGTTHYDVATNEIVKREIPGLADLAGQIGDPAVRHLGTIGGSVANSDPAADYPAAVLALKATVHTNRRAIPADQYFRGLFETALEEGEIVTRIAFPRPRRSAYEKFRNKASHYALVGVMVAELADGSIRVAVTGAGPYAFRAQAIEAALAAGFTPEAAEGAPVSADDLNDDMHAAADYRAALIPVLAGRAVARLV